MNTTAVQQNDTINQFIINVVLIEPITDILNKLKGYEFRDCDIKWLNAKLEGFVRFAAETLGINAGVSADSVVSEFIYFNEYTKKYYTEKFTILLDYFKRF